MTDSTKLAAHVVPADNQNQRATLYVKTCKLENPTENCPFLKKRQCLHSISFGDTCVYGGGYATETATKRARKYYKELNLLKEAADSVETLVDSSPPKALAFIGDYVYLPYSHMNHIDGKGHFPFLQHSGAFMSGLSFMKKEDFTPEIAAKLLTFRPRAMMGGEISYYRKEELPRFIFHLRYLYPDFFDQVASVFPKLHKGLEFIEKHVQLKEVPLRCVPSGSGEEHGYELLSKREKVTVDNWNPDTGLLTVRKTQDTKWVSSFSNLEVQKGTDLILTCTPDVETTFVHITGEALKKEVLMNHPQYIKVDKKIDLNWKSFDTPQNKDLTPTLNI